MTSHKININSTSFNVFSTSPQLEDTWRNIALGLWEPQTFEIISKLLNEKTCALEIGIDLGQTLLFTATIAGKLIAVEPSLISYNLAKQHLELNQNLKDKVTLVHGALSDTRDKIFFRKGSRLFDDIHFKGNNVDVEVRGFLIEDFEEMANEPITFINMDIEGGEYICLGPMRSYLQEKKPTLLLSLHQGFLLTTKQSQLPIIIRYLKRIREQNKIFRVIKNYPYIYDVVTMKRIYPHSLYKLKYLRGKNSLNCQILCTTKRLNKEGNFYD